MRRVAWLALVLAACTRPADERALQELAIGQAESPDARVAVGGALAAVRELADRRLVLRSQAPVLDIELVVKGDASAGEWEITIANALPDATLAVNGMTYTRDPGEHPTLARFHVPLTPGPHALRLAPPDAGIEASYRVAAMADIQDALPEVDEVFAAINAVPDLRFVVAMGDITQRAEVEEFDLFDQQLAILQIPFFTTLGNHELWGPPERYFERYGRASFQFDFKGAAFTFVDSGDAVLDPIVEGWLDDWLATARDRTHVFLTHFPPIDPVGIRYGAMRNTTDAHRLLSRLAAGAVDLTLYGHIHTYAQFENAGIPAYISGGGGAQPMRGDGIDRHFLVIELGPAGIGPVEVQRVDD
ncbi:MAG: metallophosphoesterase [Kofleriaceae bacterium]|nr:metallophosphoesterase [Kofleriaceae bacterium]